ncbi:ATP-dependent Clp protease ATP-binding subunit [Clostridium mediterraneense]|uniref:ATP-dependent Clp protease ATP-binding subunit n=1 Tax=Clostridium mediterraneense TaxID=1805472 RepID=UPI00082DF8D7|nr:ATP-dependent Clp protease ATP-binding subunit [Clostridium mediterraneense]
MFFDRFTEEARCVIEEAKNVSKELKHGYVGTEHILLGILNTECKAGQLLFNIGITTEDVYNLIKNYIGVGDIDYNMLDSPLTPRTKRILEESILEAKKVGYQYSSAEHILLTLIKDKEGVAYTILNNLDANLIKLKKDLKDYMGTEYTIVDNKNKIDERKRREKDKKEIPVLLKHGVDLTGMAMDNKLDPVIGREDETQRVLEILCRRTKNNPCLIGEPGVGKTAIAEGLAQRIIDGSIPEILKNKTIISLDLTSMVAGAKYRGEFEDRLKNVIKEVKKNPDVILFIDEIHTIVGAGGAEGAIDASNILKPALARGEIQCIGATTIDEYRRHIEKDTALERRFQPVIVGEPSKEDSLLILKGLKENYENHHEVHITEEALEAAVELSVKYINDRYLPDKAIDLIDEGSSRVKIESLKTPAYLKEVEEELASLTNKKDRAILNQEFEKAASFRDEEKNLRIKLGSLTEEWKLKKNSVKEIVDVNDIASIVARWTKIPVEKLTQKEADKLLNLEDSLSKKVIGQKEAIEAISKAVRRSRVGLKDEKRPAGSFIFLGPTGVGKTELSKALASNLFGDESHMIRVDMSEYMEKQDVSKLIGSPPGYVGYEDGGQLTEKVRRNPYSVILLDELEKAHPDVFNILLQMLEDGRLTDSKGRVVSFANTIIIMTSNLGAHTINKQSRVGFSIEDDKNDDEYQEMKNKIMGELKKSFKPEFLNRIDDIIVFRSLLEKDLLDIVDLMLKETKKKLRNREIHLHFSDESKKFLVSKGTDLKYGARPLKRVITKYLEDKLSEEILLKNIKSGDSIDVIVEDGKLNFKKRI